MDELKQASKEMIAGFVANTQSGLPIKKVLWRSGTITVKTKPDCHSYEKTSRQ